MLIRAFSFRQVDKSNNEQEKKGLNKFVLKDHQDLLLYTHLSPVERYDGRESNQIMWDTAVTSSYPQCDEVRC